MKLIVIVMCAVSAVYHISNKQAGNVKTSFLTHQMYVETLFGGTNE